MWKRSLLSKIMIESMMAQQIRRDLRHPAQIQSRRPNTCKIDTFLRLLPVWRWSTTLHLGKEAETIKSSVRADNPEKNSTEQNEFHIGYYHELQGYAILTPEAQRRQTRKLKSNQSWLHSHSYNTVCCYYQCCCLFGFCWILNVEGVP